ncbi:MAG: methyl-accepting chemotaxis protein [Gemmatimonadaceae bacterium]
MTATGNDTERRPGHRYDRHSDHPIALAPPRERDRATARPTRRRTIRGRIVAGFGVALLALLGSGLLGVLTVTSIHRDLRRGLLETAEVGGRLSQSSDATLRFVTLAQSRLLSGVTDGALRTDSLAGVADSVRQALLAGTTLTTEDRAAIEEVGGLQGRIEVRLAVAQAFLDVGRPDEAAREAAAATAVLDTLVARSAVVSKAQEQRAAVALARADASVARQRFQIAALFLAGLAAALVFGVLTWRAVTIPLGRLTGAARALGDGDLTAVPDPHGLDEEYRLLTEAFAQMAVGLRAVLRELEQGANDVAATAEELAAGAEQTNAAAEQVAGAASSIATAAAAQTSSLETIAAAAARSAQRAAQIAALAADADHAADAATRSAAAGAAAAGEALQRMAAVGEVTAEAAPAVAQLTEKVQRIGDIADAIGAIARQTNLLALNAAIEAARAGEHGRGFAVVADEVKKLAGETSRALDAIHRLTNEVRAAAARTAERFDAVRDGVDGGRTVIRASSDELARIGREIAESRSAVAGIAEAMRAQRDDSAALTREIDGVVAVAEENASTSEEVSAVVQEQAASVANVTDSSQHLASVATRLKAGMERFRL